MIKSRIIIILLAFATIASIQSSALSSEYKEMRQESRDGVSDVYDSFMQSFTTADENPKIASEQQLPNELRIRYEQAASRDPLTGISELYPNYDIEKISEYRAMGGGKINDLLKKSTTEEELVYIALARSNAVKNAEQNWYAALKLYPQADYLKDLLTRYSSFTGGGNMGDMIQMYYPSPKMLSLRGDAVEIDVEIAWQKYLEVVRDVVADTKTKLAEIRNIEETISYNRESQKLLSQLKDVADIQYRSGTRSFSDLIRIKTELEKRIDTINRLNSMNDGMYAELKSILNLEPDTGIEKISWSKPSYPQLDETKILKSIDGTRQELLVMALEVEKMNVMINMTRIEAMPDFTLGFTYYQGQESKNLAKSDENSMKSMENMDSKDSKGSMSFMENPMIDYRNTNLAPNLAWAAEMIERRDAMLSMLEDEISMSEGMLKMQFVQYDQMGKSSDVYTNSIIPQASAALDVVRTGYISGDSGLSDLIDSELALLTARIELSNTVKDRKISLVELERLIGKSLDKK
jgi:hypothetical protein